MMDTRRSSRRLQNKASEPNVPVKRKSTSPENNLRNESKVVSPKKPRIESDNSKDNVPVDSVLDKIRHDSIEACVAGASNVNLSSDSESDESSDEFQPCKVVPIDPDDSSNSKPTENQTENEQVSEYFDFSKILSKQQSFQFLLSQSNPSSENTNKTEQSIELETTPVKNSLKNEQNETTKPSSSKSSRKKSSRSDKSSTRSSDRNKSSTSSSDRNKSNSSGKSRERKSTEIKPKSEKTGDLNVKELLALGEGVDTSQLENFEEESENAPKYKIPDKVEITLDLPNATKKKKKGFDLEAALKRRLNLVKRENQVFVHKVHLLCLLSHGLCLNKSLNDEHLIGVALSLIPSKHFCPPKHADISYLENFMAWFCKKIEIEDKTSITFNIDCSNVINHLILCFNEHKADTKVDLILLFIVVMRALGLKCRLMINLQPEPLKPSSEALLPVNKPITEKSNKVKETKPKSEPEPKHKKNPRFENKREKSDKKESQNKKEKIDKKEKGKSSSTVSKYFQSESPDGKSKYFTEKGSNATSPLNQTKSNSKSDKRNLVANSKPSCSKSKQNTHSDSDLIMTDDDSDDEDFATPKKSKKTPNKSTPSKTSTKKSSAKKEKINRKVLSSDTDGESESEPSKTEKKKGLDVWCELFLEAEEKWISVDVTNQRYHCVEKLYASATHPVSYILAWNNDNTVKDLTKRYAPQWLTNTQKLRVDASWWKKTLRPYVPPSTVWEREENEELEQHLKDQPLPLSLSEYKNHPFYVLPKDLLKFQAIHPPDIPPLGYFRGEKVYPRSAVKELHTRETWLKEARVVRLGEKPFKVVKARVKKDKFGFLPTEEKKSELFGIWQTEDYIPPVAQNGVVPRNSFGNVDLFLECMLPKGTVHLQCK
uniref:DNA repair protein complementing XP-C cells n=1 Tax=Cacopsylla melanoneura TaxID=428564 RepID=A0A8D8YT42_9HEMI